MKNLFKILTLVMVFMFTVNSSFAISISKIDKQIRKSTLNETSTIAISIKNADTGFVVYEQNPKRLLHPASTLKMFTTYSSKHILGDDYTFNTTFLKDSQDNLYIKLGADPLLTSTQLKNAFQKIKNEGNTSFNNIYFDDSILDKKELAPGWMWDDEIKSSTPKVSSYNIDKNVVNVDILKLDDGSITTKLKTTYPMSVIANVVNTPEPNYLEVNRYNWNNPDVVEIYTSIDQQKRIEIPIVSMRKYFIHLVDNLLDENNITVKGTKYSSLLVPEEASVLAQIENPIAPVFTPILHNSNNLLSETLYKLTVSKAYASTGSNDLAQEAFKEFYNKLGVKTDDIIVKDGCGVSRKTLVYVDWMTDALNKIYKQKDFESYKELLAQAGDGTLSRRLFNLRGDAWFKTGSLSNLSAITGYVKSNDGNTYSVAIIIQGFKEPQSEIKAFENELIELIYKR